MCVCGGGDERRAELPQVETFALPGTLLRSSLSGCPAWVTRGDLFGEGMGNSGQAGGFSTSGCQGSRKKVEVPEVISPFRFFFRQLLSHTRCLWFPVV